MSGVMKAHLYYWMQMPIKVLLNAFWVVDVFLDANC